MISKRVQAIDTSGIRKVFDLGAKLKDPINLSIGQPDFDAWPELRQGAKRAIDEGKSGYTVTQGIEPLRQALRERYGLKPAQEAFDFDVFVTSGVSGALMLSYLALLDPDDEILIPDPFFCIYKDLLTLIHAKPVFYDCYETEFHLPIDEIESKISSKTKAILINSPSNPTGISLSEEELDAVIEIARKHDIWLIYDEIYEIFNYDAQHINLLGKCEKTLIINGFSKSFGIPGWRVGFAIGPKVLLQEMIKVQQYSFVCSPSIAQWGALEGFSISFEEVVNEYRAKRDFIYDALKDKFNVVKPNGAFYIFPEAPGGKAEEFVKKCIENNLLVIPAGGVFSNRDTHFRISFAAKQETLEKAVEVLHGLV